MVANAARAKSVEIRVLDEADATALFRVRLEALQREARAFTESETEHRAHNVEEIAARTRPTAEGFSLGAFVSGNLVGTLRFERSQRQKQRHRGSLHAMYVDAEHRYRGIGRALMEEMLRRLRKIECLEQIELHVATDQEAARRLYESFGFTHSGKQPRALKIGDEYVDYGSMILLPS